MRTSGSGILLRAAALLCAAMLLPATADAQDQTKQGEKAIEARQGFMRVIVWEAGPLFGMAKGDIAYDADAAAGNAESLDALVQYDVTRLFIPDTSAPVYAGKTRALPKIWEDRAGFEDAFRNLREKVSTLTEQAGNGKDALTAAVSELGKACGNCHDNYRADDF